MVTFCSCIIICPVINMVNLLVIKHLLLAVTIGSQVGGMNEVKDCVSCVIETVPFQQRPL